MGEAKDKGLFRVSMIQRAKGRGKIDPRKPAGGGGGGGARQIQQDKDVRTRVLTLSPTIPPPPIHHVQEAGGPSVTLCSGTVRQEYSRYSTLEKV